MDKPSLFIGSSTEGLDIARAVRSLLTDDAEVTLWNEGFFTLGITFIETLANELSRFDFAVLILTPDDLIHSRDTESFGPRDSIVFELGLFTPGLGRSQTFIVRPRDLKLPTDLSGVTTAAYEHSKENARLSTVLGPTCDSIRNAIRALGPSDHKAFRKIDKLESRQENIESSIRTLQIVIRGLVTEYECDKLRGLSGEVRFMVRFNSKMMDELYRLRALRYIEDNPGYHISSIRERDGKQDEFDLKQYVHITAEGNEYLRLRDDLIGRTAQTSR